MKIKSAELIASEVDVEKFPQGANFEIVLIGKSNVGKSSFINAMIERKSLARTSSQPGKTRTANFYHINNEFYFVDMPGYGYAKVSKSIKDGFEKLLRAYFLKREADYVVFFLLDHRHPPTQNDIAMYNNLISNNINPIVILTKTDKLKQNEKSKLVKIIKNDLDLDESDMLFEVSIDNKKQLTAVWDFIEQLMYSE